MTSSPSPTPSSPSPAVVPLGSRAHRDRVERERVALVARLGRKKLRRFKLSVLAASRTRADAFGVGLSGDERERIRAAARWPALRRVLAEMVRARRVDIATVALAGRTGDVGTNAEIVVRAEFVAFLDVAAEAAVARSAGATARRRVDPLPTPATELRCAACTRAASSELAATVEANSDFGDGIDVEGTP